MRELAPGTNKRENDKKFDRELNFGISLLTRSGTADNSTTFLRDFTGEAKSRLRT